jgi:murein DD-endopeptidase MepM/ murein hydrolase activator NlpD
MKQLLTLVLGLAGIAPAFAQPAILPPDGGGSASFSHVPCLSAQQAADIEAMLSRNITMLPAQPAAGAKKTAALRLGWPLRQATGFSYDYLYGIGQYVDHDPIYPNHVLDWNCGSRTYDQASGYNHSGTDIFLWPFPQNMMASGQAEIVAAAPGIIIGKEDGHYDLSCSMSGGTWNAVYVMHADSTVAWYGHMKKYSLTTKNIGDPVAQGEFLGLVGSSGNSSGPHLHFELHDKNGQVLDPFHGSCNSGSGYWQTQKPYYESAINTLMTHSAPPQLQSCPNLDIINAKDTFDLNDPITFAAYYHDQQAGQNAVFSVLKPDGSSFASWQSASATSYVASYWYWSKNIPADAPRGIWQFKASFQSRNYVHPFFVNGIPAGVAPAGNFSGSMHPNPADKELWLRLNGAAQISICNTVGQHMLSQAYHAGVPVALHGLNEGLYFLVLDYADGHRETARLQVAH